MQVDCNTILITWRSLRHRFGLAHRFHDSGNHDRVAGRRQAALDKAIAGRERMMALTLDVEEPRAIKASAQRAVAEHPALNVPINNAGIINFEDATAKRNLADAQATVVTNLLGPIRLTDALIDHLSGQPDAVILAPPNARSRFEETMKTMNDMAAKAKLGGD